MSELIKNQNFGVEVEFTGITRAMAAQAVADVLGVSRIDGPRNDAYYTRSIKDSRGRTWKVMRDSSIAPESRVGNKSRDEYKVEFVTPILQYSDMETLQAIIRKFREIGGKANSSCGIHVHVGGEKHSASSLRRLVNFMKARQDIIYDALQIGIRKDRWCRPISDKLNQALKQERELTLSKTEQIWYSEANDNYRGGIDHSHYNTTRYHALNLHSFFTKKSIEFRLFNSTLHAGKIKAYVQFCLAMSAWAIESGDRVVFRSISNYSDQQKVTLMYHILTNRLGLFGDEYKTCRLHMMKALKAKAQAVTTAA